MARKSLGIDLIWFGVMLCVNMQTSFMHPPFGFALFYLRGVAPKESYLDRVTGKRMERSRPAHLLGRAALGRIQVIMVLLVITFPIDGDLLDKARFDIDPNKIKIEVPQIDAAAAGFRSAGKAIAIRASQTENPGARAPGSFVWAESVNQLCECRAMKLS